jgi:hypothetical protein
VNVELSICRRDRSIIVRKIAWLRKQRASSMNELAMEPERIGTATGTIERIINLSTN